MSKEQTPITADQQTIKDLWNANSASEIVKILSDYKKRVVLEALEPILKEIQELKKINELIKSDVKLAKSLLEELKQK